MLIVFLPKIYFMRNLYLLLFVFFIVSCNTNSTQQELTSENEIFDIYKADFVEKLWEVYPDWSTYAGYEKYDGLIKLPNKENGERELEFLSANLKYLNNLKMEELSDANKTDYYLIKNLLEKNLWHMETFKSYEWNPASYNVAGGFATILGNKKIDLQEKLSRIAQRITYVPEYYRLATGIINNPTLEHTNLAIQQIAGAKKYLETTVRDSAKAAWGTTANFSSFEISLDSAVNAIDGYIKFLSDNVKPKLEKGTPRDFRIAKELFEQKFNFDIHSTFTAEEIYKKAVEAKAALHGKMAELSGQLWPKYFPGKPQPADSLAMVKLVIDKIAENHVHRDSFISAIEQQIPALEKFIKEKNLIYMDPSKPLVVRKTPDYMDGVAGASISAPGPYDKDGDTFYNVTPLTGYSEKEAKSYLKEYNHYVLQILNIHEALPGHYLQLVYSNQSPSIIKSILGNGSMIEGWAVYTERMMLEEGYGNHEPEMWLMYYKWHLRVVCNTILDYSVHVLGFDEQQGLNLLMKEAFQESAEAKGKWKRATLSQVQLCSYFTGYTEIYSLREELKSIQGQSFNLKDFHEKFLSYGSAPVKYIRALMLSETAKAN
jgi:uncharacterized protein (DUF885 family)